MRRMIKALIVALLAMMCGSTARAEPTQIRMSFIVPVTNWATMLFQTPGLAKHLNQSYTFEAIHFQGTPLLVQAIAAGQLEIGNMSYASLPLAIINAGM